MVHLREIRQIRGWSQSEIAEVLEWSESKVQRVEAGEVVELSTEDRIKLIRAYRLSQRIALAVPELAAKVSE